MCPSTPAGCPDMVPAHAARQDQAAWLCCTGQASPARAAALWHEHGAHFSHEEKRIDKKGAAAGLTAFRQRANQCKPKQKITPRAVASTDPCPCCPAAWGQGLQSTTPSPGKLPDLAQEVQMGVLEPRCLGAKCSRTHGVSLARVSAGRKDAIPGLCLHTQPRAKLVR